MPNNIIDFGGHHFVRNCPIATTTKIREQVDRRHAQRRRLLSLSDIIRKAVAMSRDASVSAAAAYLASEGIPVETARRVLTGGCRDTDFLPRWSSRETSR